VRRGLKIVALGDSTTAGTPGFLSPLEAPPKGRGNVESQYAYWMMKLHPDWVVLNRGINGQRSDLIAARLERDVILERPDYAIILAGANDVYQRRPTTWVEKSLIGMYKRCLRAGIRIVTATILPYNGMSREEYESMSELNRWIRRVSEDMGASFCDTNAVVSDPNDPSQLRSSPDGLHPDPKGYRRIGEALARAIEVAEAAFRDVTPR